jgi:hypothetical protein
MLQTTGRQETEFNNSTQEVASRHFFLARQETPGTAEEKRTQLLSIRSNTTDKQQNTQRARSHHLPSSRPPVLQDFIEKKLSN